MRLRADDRAHIIDIDETFPVKVQPGFPVQELLDGVVSMTCSIAISLPRTA